MAVVTKTFPRGSRGRVNFRHVDLGGITTVRVGRTVDDLTVVVSLRPGRYEVAFHVHDESGTEQPVVIGKVVLDVDTVDLDDCPSVTVPADRAVIDGGRIAA
jgi:hypothetical protein